MYFDRTHLNITNSLVKGDPLLREGGTTGNFVICRMCLEMNIQNSSFQNLATEKNGSVFMIL